MTETINAEPVVISAKPPKIEEKIAKRKTIVYQASIDPTVIRVSGEKLKKQLFTKFGLFKPKSEEIQFVSLEKYYEPYIVISGRYFLDYYRKRTYVFKVDKGVKEVVLFKKIFVPSTSVSSRNTKIIKLHGEERLTQEENAFLILDKNGHDSDAANLQSAPSENNPEKVIQKLKIEKLAENADVNFVKERIIKRPKELCRVIEEIFEISDRSVIYTPRFKLLFKNVRTGEEKVLVLDGVTSQRI
ncbi:MAG: hypothetical protein NWE80_03495 [Candidatus Bathyarchaeota archaeon]|nr:hypothetical protein [Candidatus Bathyarchaeota archaeon]